jgi:pyruvate kinase
VELREAVENLEEIIRASDGVMVARGDLGVELAPEEVPRVQKDILLRCDALGIPSITATQMLESMIENPRPTRAEVTDVYNAVLDGTGAVMLSAETAVGKHPLEAVRVMGRIAERAERELLDPRNMHERRRAVSTSGIADVVAHGAARAAEEVGAKAILSLTHHGLTARVLAKHKPRVPVYAATTRERTYRQMGLLWGVTPVLCRYHEDEWEALGAVRDAVLQHGWLKPDDVVVVVNSRRGVRAQSNTLRVAPLRDIGPA